MCTVADYVKFKSQKKRITPTHNANENVRMKIVFHVLDTSFAKQTLIPAVELYRFSMSILVEERQLRGAFYSKLSIKSKF